jgi:hypothetical protein
VPATAHNHDTGHSRENRCEVAPSPIVHSLDVVNPRAPASVHRGLERLGATRCFMDADRYSKAGGQVESGNGRLGSAKANCACSGLVHHGLHHTVDVVLAARPRPAPAHHNLFTGLGRGGAGHGEAGVRPQPEHGATRASATRRSTPDRHALVSSEPTWSTTARCLRERVPKRNGRRILALRRCCPEFSRAKGRTRLGLSNDVMAGR